MQFDELDVTLCWRELTTNECVWGSLCGVKKGINERMSIREGLVIWTMVCRLSRCIVACWESTTETEKVDQVSKEHLKESNVFGSGRRNVYKI